MLVNFNLEGLEEKDKREIKYLLQTINDTLEAGIWKINIKEGNLADVLSDSLFNTKIGTEALHFNTAGYRNSVLGYQTLYFNTLGYKNIALGYQALYSNITGYANSGVGYQALYKNTTGYENTVLGYQILYSNTTGYRNIALGFQTLYLNSTGYRNMAIGYQALYSNTTSNFGTAIGYRTLYSNTTGGANTAIGDSALRDNISGAYNVAIGRLALYQNTTEHFNVAIGDSALSGGVTTGSNTAIGYQSLYDSTTAHGNVAIGRGTGFHNETGDLNIFLGIWAGYNETGSKKLYIDVSNTTTPLIYGDFDNEFIEIYGNLGIGTRTFGTSATRTLAMLNGTVPSTSPANAIQLYAEDVSSSSELKVRDEATNVTTLSPHNFELFKPDKNDPFPWSYHSINQLIGKKVNADISGALRELEVLTGKKFLYYEDVNKISLSEYMEEKKEQLIALYIEENGNEVEVEKAEAWGKVEVEVQDIKEIIGYDTKYEFDERTGKVKEIKKPKYGKKTVLKNKLKKGYMFNEETGKFLKKIKPTEVEAEKAIKKELVIPKWIEDRL